MKFLFPFFISEKLQREERGSDNNTTIKKCVTIISNVTFAFQITIWQSKWEMGLRFWLKTLFGWRDNTARDRQSQTGDRRGETSPPQPESDMEKLKTETSTGETQTQTLNLTTPRWISLSLSAKKTHNVSMLSNGLIRWWNFSLLDMCFCFLCASNSPNCQEISLLCLSQTEKLNTIIL